MASIKLNETFGTRYEQANPFVNKFAGTGKRKYSIVAAVADSGWAYAAFIYGEVTGKTGIVNLLQAMATKGSRDLANYAKKIIKNTDREVREIDLGEDFPESLQVTFDDNGNITKVAK